MQFQRVGPRVMLVQPNQSFRSSSKNPLERKSVEDSFAKSILWGFTVAAESGGRVLVDATDFFLRDVTAPPSAAARQLPRRSHAQRVLPAEHEELPEEHRSRHDADLRQRSRPAAAAAAAVRPRVRRRSARRRRRWRRSAAAVCSPAAVGSVTPSAEAVTLREHASFVELPDDNYSRAHDDPRAGYGGITFVDYSAADRRADPVALHPPPSPAEEGSDAAMSEPVKPIQYWVDSGAPEDVKKALIEGASWWNQAFEAAGFRNAFKVDVLPDGADPMDIRYNMINWVHRSTRGWSSGGIGVRSAHRRDHQGHGHARIAARSAGLHDLRGPAVALRQRQRAAGGPLRDGAGAHPPAVGARSRPHARPRPQLLRQHQGLDLGDGLSASARGAEGRRHHRLSKAYAARIGDWDKVAINYGYREFPTGTNEAPALTKILDDAWAQDLRYFTNQDTDIHPRVEQWSNGVNQADELTG